MPCYSPPILEKAAIFLDLFSVLALRVPLLINGYHTALLFLASSTRHVLNEYDWTQFLIQFQINQSRSHRGKFLFSFI